jgi:hypothetical protein
MTVSESNGGDYEVGFKRPPEHTRFKKGESGNQKGRPKGTKNLKTDLHEELNEWITIKEGERTKKISKQRAFLKTVLSKAMKGDGRAGATLVTILSRTTDLSATDANPATPISEQEEELLKALAKRLESCCALGLDHLHPSHVSDGCVRRTLPSQLACRSDGLASRRVRRRPHQTPSNNDAPEVHEVYLRIGRVPGLGAGP